MSSEAKEWTPEDLEALAAATKDFWARADDMLTYMRDPCATAELHVRKTQTRAKVEGLMNTLQEIMDVAGIASTSMIADTSEMITQAIIGMKDDETIDYLYSCKPVVEKFQGSVYPPSEAAHLAMALFALEMIDALPRVATSSYIARAVQFQLACCGLLSRAIESVVDAKERGKFAAELARLGQFALLFDERVPPHHALSHCLANEDVMETFSHTYGQRLLWAMVDQLLTDDNETGLPRDGNDLLQVLLHTNGHVDYGALLACERLWKGARAQLRRGRASQREATSTILAILAQTADGCRAILEHCILDDLLWGIEVFLRLTPVDSRRRYIAKTEGLSTVYCNMLDVIAALLLTMSREQLKRERWIVCHECITEFGSSTSHLMSVNASYYIILLMTHVLVPEILMRRDENAETQQVLLYCQQVLDHFHMWVPDESYHCLASLWWLLSFKADVVERLLVGTQGYRQFSKGIYHASTSQLPWLTLIDRACELVLGDVICEPYFKELASTVWSLSAEMQTHLAG